MEPEISNTWSAQGENYIDQKKTTSLLNLPLEVIEFILPHLPPQALLALSLVSRAYYSLVFSESKQHRNCLRAWRHLSLAQSTPSASNKYREAPETILTKPYIFQHVRTLILDGLPSVTASLLEDILNVTRPLGASHQIQILSIRGCSKIDERSVAQTILTDSYPLPPSLKGVYIFSDPAQDHAITPGARSFVTAKLQRALDSARQRSSTDFGWWEESVLSLRGRIVFDSEMCRGLDHYRQQDHSFQFPPPRLATMRITSGCAGCGMCPSKEDGTQETDAMFPPVPLHSSQLSTAQSSMHLRTQPSIKPTLRCMECLDKRFCRGCGRWWCRPCSISRIPDIVDKVFAALGRVSMVSLDCFECGFLCEDCNKLHSKRCKSCSGSYCISHNEGSNTVFCEWCALTNAQRRLSTSSVYVGSGNLRRTLNTTSPSPTLSATGGPFSPVSSPVSDIELALTNTAVLSDPTTPQPRSPHLGPIPQPVILLASRVPAAGMAEKQTQKQAESSGTKGVGFSPNMKATTPEMHRAAGMRLRTMMNGSLGMTGGGGGRAGGEVDRKRWLVRGS